MSKLTRVLIFDAFLPWDSGILVFMTINLPPFTKPTIPLKLLKKNHKFSHNHISKSANCEKLQNTQLYEHTLSKRWSKTSKLINTSSFIIHITSNKDAKQNKFFKNVLR